MSARTESGTRVYLDNGIFAIAISKMKDDPAENIYEKLRAVCSNTGSLLPLEPYVSMLKREDIETGEDCITAAELFRSHDPGTQSGLKKDCCGVPLNIF